MWQKYNAPIEQTVMIAHVYIIDQKECFEAYFK